MAASIFFPVDDVAFWLGLDEVPKEGVIHPA